MKVSVPLTGITAATLAAIVLLFSAPATELLAEKAGCNSSFRNCEMKEVCSVPFEWEDGGWSCKGDYIVHRTYYPINPPDNPQ